MTTQDLEQIGNLIDAKLEPIKKDMATKQDLASVKQEIKEAIKREAETMADFFQDTWDMMQTTKERVEKIEDHLGLPHPHKN